MVARLGSASTAATSARAIVSMPPRYDPRPSAAAEASDPLQELRRQGDRRARVVRVLQEHRERHVPAVPDEPARGVRAVAELGRAGLAVNLARARGAPPRAAG